MTLLLNKIVEYRSMPSYVEERHTLVSTMEEIVENAKKESRSLKSAEEAQFQKCKKRISEIDLQMAADQVKETRGFKKATTGSIPEEEKRAFLDYIVKGDMRALSASPTGSGGALIPTSISSQIVDKVIDMSPILQKCTMFNTSSDLNVPIFDFTKLSVGYIFEGTEITETSQEFSQLKLQNHIIGSLVKLGCSLINRSDIDVVQYIIGAVAKSISVFLEKELINGLGGDTALGGLATLPPEQIFAGVGGDITGDQLVDIQLSLPQLYQENAIWVTNPSTLSTIRKLKATGSGEYLFSNGAFAQDMTMQLLGKPVFVSDAVAPHAPDVLSVYYLDPAALYVKLTKDVMVSILDQAYASTYQVGILGAIECDSGIGEPQGIVALQGSAV